MRRSRRRTKAKFAAVYFHGDTYGPEDAAAHARVMATLDAMPAAEIVAAFDAVCAEVRAATARTRLR